MSGHVPQISQIPTNWWGYGMPPELFAISSRLPQVFDVGGKDLVPSAALVFRR